jgi:hypothetical protein
VFGLSTVNTVAAIKTAAIVTAAAVTAAAVTAAAVTAAAVTAAAVYQRGHWFVSSISDVGIMWNITAEEETEIVYCTGMGIPTGFTQVQPWVWVRVQEF